MPRILFASLVIFGILTLAGYVFFRNTSCRTLDLTNNIYEGCPASGVWTGYGLPPYYTKFVSDTSPRFVTTNFLPFFLLINIVFSAGLAWGIVAVMRPKKNNLQPESKK